LSPRKAISWATFISTFAVKDGKTSIQGTRMDCSRHPASSEIDSHRSLMNFCAQFIETHGEYIKEAIYLSLGQG
jgi:hypothetical protein